MPIYAPTLPPRPDLTKAASPILVLAKFDLARMLRQKLGRFFGIVFLGVLAINLMVLYAKHLMVVSPDMAQLKDFAELVLPQPASFQASLLHPSMLFFLWFQAALISGGLIARDTLHRIRPLIYAHPVRPSDYVASKAISAIAVPLCVQFLFIFLPWLLSLLIAGPDGPVWPTAPLYLIPAAAINSVLIASVALGASSISSTPKSGFGWALALLFGSTAIGGILAGIFRAQAWLALSPMGLTDAWPRILCGVEGAHIPLWAAAASTSAHFFLWTYVVVSRTRPSEAV